MRWDSLQGTFVQAIRETVMVLHKLQRRPQGTGDAHRVLETRGICQEMSQALNRARSREKSHLQQMAWPQA